MSFSAPNSPSVSMNFVPNTLSAVFALDYVGYFEKASGCDESDESSEKRILSGVLAPGLRRPGAVSEKNFAVRKLFASYNRSYTRKIGRKSDIVFCIGFE